MTTAQVASHSRTIRSKADAMFANRDLWARGTARVNGALIGIVLFTSSRNPQTVYLTRCDAGGCSCPAAQKSSTGRCSHRLAVALDVQAAQAPKPLDDGDDLGLVDL